jgi:hypothetical protein
MFVHVCEGLENFGTAKIVSFTHGYVLESLKLTASLVDRKAIVPSTNSALKLQLSYLMDDIKTLSQGHCWT